jgi:hypothetical protein
MMVNGPKHVVIKIKNKRYIVVLTEYRNVLLSFNLTSSYVTSTRVSILLCTRQEGQCTYDVTLRSVRVPLLQWRSGKNCTF